MNCTFHKSFILLTGLMLGCIQLSAQNSYKADRRAKWLKNAEENQPQIVTTVRRPKQLVSIVEDSSAFQNFRAVFKSSMKNYFMTSMKKNSGEILDFRKHLTGFVTFRVDTLGLFDGAIRLKFTFAEVPSEAVLPFDSYDGALSRAWLQDELITITELPAVITIPRRVAFRYVKVEVVGCSDFGDFKMTDLYVTSSTSAKKEPAPLAPGTPDLIRKIDAVALHTLRECMQTVYEDGPKRDRRLWIGDLYLEMLANQYSFQNDSLTRRCLYLLAGLSYEDGVVPSNVYEQPVPYPQINPILDYALIFNVALKDYLSITGDRKTAEDLWEVAKRQVDVTRKYIRKNGLMDAAQADTDWWLFFDWKEGLDKQTSLQGCVIWAFSSTLELAEMLGKEQELADLPEEILRMKKAAREHLYDPQRMIFISGGNRQVSFASQVWMVLSGVADQKEGEAIFKKLSQLSDDVVYPGSPYLYHYVVEAMIKCGLEEEARNVITGYWGGMVNKGADTFWEVYDPHYDFASPYNSILVNSYCHAWSCTPVYFIRKYPEIFQRR